MNKLNIIIFGDDGRLRTVASRLIQEGHDVKMYVPRGDNAADRYENLQCDVLILPTPYKTADGKIKGTDVTLSDISEKLSQAKHIILGKADSYFIDTAHRLNINYTDLAEDMRFKIINAIPSAEAAVEIAMQKTPYTLWQANVLICGFGCIGKSLARILTGFGCRITIAARKDADLCKIEECGWNPANINEISNVVRDYKIIFNTCPAPILTKDVLQYADPSCIIIDLASNPGGTDFEYADLIGLDAGLYLALPEKYAPQAAGENMYKVVSLILKNIKTKRS